MSEYIPTWIKDAVAEASQPPIPNEVTVTRYPFTYAYDFIRSHQAAFGLTEDLGRSGTSGWLHRRIFPEKYDGGVFVLRLTEDERIRYHNICCLIADAYIAEWSLVWPNGT